MPKLKVVSPRLKSPIEHTKSDSVNWDVLIPQLGLRTRNGKQTWIVQTRINGKSVRRTLGEVVGIGLDQARVLAEACLGGLEIEKPHLAASTSIKQFAPLFFEQCKGRWKPATRGGHLSNLNNQILPLLGDRKVSQIAQHDVITWYNQMGGAAGTKNRALAVGLVTVLFRVLEWNRRHQGEQVWPRSIMKNSNAKQFA